jgi:hypothetical protein
MHYVRPLTHSVSGMNRSLILVALVGANLTISAAPSVSIQSVRYKALAKIINRNVGHAHMTRGVNVCTILALRDAVTEQDLEVLGGLLEANDSVHRLAAGYVLSVMGPTGIGTLRSRGARLGPVEAENMAANAESTKQSLSAYRVGNNCGLKQRQPQ